jgi:hypothetical protein
MIGSLFLLDRQLPNVKQRTTAVIYDSKLILYNNGKNPQVPLLMLNLAEATINEGIEKSERFCICLNHTVYEFEALDLDERSEWVYELTKRSKDGCHLFDHDDASDEYDILDDDEDKGYDEDGSSIYEEVGEASRIYDIPKRMEEDNPRSLSPPPPLPLRVLKVETNNEEDFPPPPAFEDSPIPHVVPPPPPMPKPTKMIPPPPPPNSNKIQIFTKSSFKAVSSITNKKQQPPQPPTSRSKKTSASSTTSCSSSGKPSEKFVLRNRKNYSSSSSSSEPVIIFEDELKQKLLQNIAKKSFLDIDETTFRNQHRAKKDQPDMEEELKAILDKRRQQLLSTNSLSPSNSNFRKTASFRLPPPDKKFDSLPPKPSTLKKPKLPEKKPLFVRSDSLKIHSWNHRLSTGKTIQLFFLCLCTSGVLLECFLI